MTKYIVFPIPVGFIEVEASSVKAALNKYRRAMPDMSENELIIAPQYLAHKTSIDLILPLWKCGFNKIK